MATVLAENAPPGLTNITQSSRSRGAVFTPSYLATWAAELVRENSASQCSAIADFGCGTGNLLLAARHQFPESKLLGVELDEASTREAEARLGTAATLIAGDFLEPSLEQGEVLSEYWLRRLSCQPDAVIMNPPWGAGHGLSKLGALSSGLALAWGQYDTYDLFCELALQILRPKGAFVFIIPDSIFLPEHQRLREMLANRTTITMIARLGEGIFPAVYRGCVVVAGRHAPAGVHHEVECLRITRSQRRLIQTGGSLAECRKKSAHWVPQIRFIKDPQHRFDIDVSVNDTAMAKIIAVGGSWTSPLNSRRGAEISKGGRVLICDRCASARPYPKSDHPICLKCGSSLSDNPRTIVADQPDSDGVWHPFIVGEDVGRYRAATRRWIRTDLTGINYKQPTRSGECRILIRKTGVGLHAALDSSGAFTNQVVFEYTLNPGAKFPFSYLHYALGVLCSRSLFAFHLKRGGDLEWRSHPYVTQKTLADLPIPLPKPGSHHWRQAAAIAEAVVTHVDGVDRDLQIEGLVAELFGLDEKDMEWVARVLSEAADLEAIKAMRVPSGVQIQPISAS